jgi:hypothetical protein
MPGFFGAIFELTQLVGSRVLINVIFRRSFPTCYAALFTEDGSCPATSASTGMFAALLRIAFKDRYCTLNGQLRVSHDLVQARGC